jgi:hypothetical protein
MPGEDIRFLRIEERLTSLDDTCRTCREEVLARVSDLGTELKVLESQHTLMQRAVYALLGSILMAVTAALLRLVLR